MATAQEFLNPPADSVEVVTEPADSVDSRG